MRTLVRPLDKDNLFKKILSKCCCWHSGASGVDLDEEDRLVDTMTASRAQPTAALEAWADRSMQTI